MRGYGGMAHVYANKAPTPLPCSSCNGSGWMETETITMPCQDCNGSGQAADPKVSVIAIVGTVAFLIVCYIVLFYFMLRK